MAKICDSCRGKAFLCQACDHERRLEALERLVGAMARRGEWKLRCGSTGGECNARLGECGPRLYGVDCPEFECCSAELRELLLAGARHG